MSISLSASASVNVWIVENNQILRRQSDVILWFRGYLYRMISLAEHGIDGYNTERPIVIFLHRKSRIRVRRVYRITDVRAIWYKETKQIIELQAFCIFVTEEGEQWRYVTSSRGRQPRTIDILWFSTNEADGNVRRIHTLAHSLPCVFLIALAAWLFEFFSSSTYFYRLNFSRDNATASSITSLSKNDC